MARRYVALLGGVSVTVTGQHQRWSYPNVHGDVMATADASGAKEGPTVVYTPDGQALGPVPGNLDGPFGYGWLGSHQRPTEHADGLAPVVQMGARPYLPSIGRFLAQGPVDGGSANAYDYLSGDPVNGLDLTGMAEQLGPSPATCIDLQPYVEEIVMSTECKVMREARFRENAGVSFDYNATVPYSETSVGTARSISLGTVAMGLRVAGVGLGCVIRPKADTDSGGNRTPVPDESGHAFRLVPDT
ncbi:MAG: RHS repeat-associated core domain-containing protein [Actinomycetota bacterium]